MLSDRLQDLELIDAFHLGHSQGSSDSLIYASGVKI